MDKDSLRVESERIRCVFEQARLTLLVAVINAGLTALVLRPFAPPDFLQTWLTLHVVVGAVRLAVRQAFLRRRPEGIQCRPWMIASVVGSATTGVLWGVGAIMLFPDSEPYQLFLAFVIGGLCAGSVTVNSSHLPTVLAFILPAGLPLAVCFLMQPSPIRVVSALMILLFAASLSVTSARAHQGFGERMRLQLALTREQRNLRHVNEQLRSEVAERRKTEAELQQARKLQTIGHLTGGIAHDFNNLMQIIGGKLELIRRTSGAQSRTLDYISDSEQALRQGAQLTNTLLAFARPQTMRMETVNINDVLHEFRPILLQATAQNVRLTYELAPDVPSCRTDPGQLQAAILNLVINARDAMPDGGQIRIITHSVRLDANQLCDSPESKPGIFVGVTVQDEGIGMTEAVRSQAFEPFFTTKDANKGNGLGLSQIHLYARQSGGRVTLDSAPGRGTQVSLFLPSQASSPT